MKKLFLYMYLLVPFFGMGQAIHFGTLGGGFSNQTSNAVRALYYDTLSKKLYAGGQFNLTEGKPVWGASVWNGSNWDSLAGGLTKYPHQPVTINTAGPIVWKIIGYQGKIYYLGGFDWVNGKNQYNMGVWNGSNWDYPLAQPLSANSIIYDMKVHNGILYACGDFTAIGNVVCNYVAKYDGVNWQPVGDFSEFHSQGHPPARMRAIDIFNNEIYVGGAFDDTSGIPQNIAKYNGIKWVNVSTGIRQGGVNSIATLQSYNNKLYIGGYFSRTNEIPGEGFVAWDGNSYVRAAEYDLNGHGNIYSFTIHKNKLAVLGGFNKYGPYEAINLLFIDSTKQCAINGMYAAWTNTLYSWFWGSMASMGDSLILGGQFNYIDTVPAKNIAFIRNYESRSNCIYTGIDENYFDNSIIKIYPNPAASILRIEIEWIETKKNRLSILNTLGQNVYVLNNVVQKQEIDLSFLPIGIYFLRLQNNSDQKTFKIIKE